MIKLYQRLAVLVQAYHNCVKSGNDVWRERHAAVITALCHEHLPHGSGLDGERTTVDLEKSSASKLVLAPADYHHMTEGMYSGWSEHTIVVTGDLIGLRVKATGRDRNFIKEYLEEIFHDALTLPVCDEEYKTLCQQVQTEIAG